MEIERPLKRLNRSPQSRGYWKDSLREQNQAEIDPGFTGDFSLYNWWGKLSKEKNIYVIINTKMSTATLMTPFPINYI